MTIEQHERALEIRKELYEIDLLLKIWNAMDRYNRPLKFTYVENTDMNFVPEEALKQFKDACIDHLNNRTKELQDEFDKL